MDEGIAALDHGVSSLEPMGIGNVPKFICSVLRKKWLEALLVLFETRISVSTKHLPCSCTPVAEVLKRVSVSDSVLSFSSRQDIAKFCTLRFWTTARLFSGQN